MNKTEEKINRVFLDLLNEKDFNSITISEISRKCNITRTYFYQFYTDKNELATITFLNINEELFREFAKTFSSLNNHQVYFESILQGMIQIHKNAEILDKLLTIVGPNLDLTKYFEKYLSKNIRQQLLKNRPKEDEAKVDYFLSVFATGTVTTILWIIKHKEISAYQEAEWLDNFTWTAFNKLL